MPICPVPAAKYVTVYTRPARSVEKAGSLQLGLASTTVAMHFVKSGHIYQQDTVTALRERDGNCAEACTSGYQTQTGPTSGCV